MPKNNRLIMECRQSGLTVHQWCVEHDIKPGTFYNWVKRLRQKGCVDLPASTGRSYRVPEVITWYSKARSEEYCMIYYQEGFCGGYRQSMPVVYEKSSDGDYHKIKMYCQNREGCEKDACKCFEDAPEIMQVHLMRENRIRTFGFKRLLLSSLFFLAEKESFGYTKSRGGLYGKRTNLYFN